MCVGERLLWNNFDSRSVHTPSMSCARVDAHVQDAVV